MSRVDVYSSKGLSLVDGFSSIDTPLNILMSYLGHVTCGAAPDRSGGIQSGD